MEPLRLGVSSRLLYQSTVRIRAAVLLCLGRLRDEHYGKNYVAAESSGTTPTVKTLEGRLAFQMIESDDVWHYLIGFLGPEEEREGEEEMGDGKDAEDKGSDRDDEN